jgi:acyl-CoA synthetase (NDP forming)
MDQWLVRTAKNQLAGPFSREQVRVLIKEGRLSLQDEVCQASGYWIYLHEREEVSAALGADVPETLVASSGEESTVTGTDTEVVEKTDPELDHARPLPELALNPNDGPDNTAVLSNRAFRQFRMAHSPQKKPAAVAELPKEIFEPQVQSSALEKPSLWRGIALFLVVLSGALVFAVLKVLSR